MHDRNLSLYFSIIAPHWGSGEDSRSEEIIHCQILNPIILHSLVCICTASASYCVCVIVRVCVCVRACVRVYVYMYYVYMHTCIQIYVGAFGGACDYVYMCVHACVLLYCLCPFTE